MKMLFLLLSIVTTSIPPVQAEVINGDMMTTGLFFGECLVDACMPTIDPQVIGPCPEEKGLVCSLAFWQSQKNQLNEPEIEYENA